MEQGARLHHLGDHVLRNAWRQRGRVRAGTQGGLILPFAGSLCQRELEVGIPLALTRLLPNTDHLRPPSRPAIPSRAGQALCCHAIGGRRKHHLRLCGLRFTLLVHFIDTIESSLKFKQI